MGSGGHNRKPALAVVREGNPGKRPIKDTVVLPPTKLVEPDWDLALGEVEAKVASELWAKLAPTLAVSIGLVGAQQESLVDYCITWARIAENEAALTSEGMLISGAQGGLVKNPRTTILNQYRSNLRSLMAKLGLTPADAAGIARPESSDEDDPFD
ncbi:P27 family phage terminase small subunit [Nocardioides sp. BE266]|uniref:P27 family phage terminase small subunit n=1 Tax=Nocardioides sp. BE266 TaxID=2817725 RepID=UPI00286BD74F|nr:P27 family phage terminase small subunit [Nocardioides sp. BE266]